MGYKKDHFNSSVVRLKDPLFNCSDSKRFLFQFQCGAIKRTHRTAINALINAFQFQCGAIKRKVELMEKLALKHFNSSVVRLKGFTVKYSVCFLIAFQFQCGAIKRMSGDT